MWCCWIRQEPLPPAVWKLYVRVSFLMGFSMPGLTALVNVRGTEEQLCQVFVSSLSSPAIWNLHTTPTNPHNLLWRASRLSCITFELKLFCFGKERVTSHHICTPFSKRQLWTDVLNSPHVNVHLAHELSKWCIFRCIYWISTFLLARPLLPLTLSSLKSLSLWVCFVGKVEMSCSRAGLSNPTLYAFQPHPPYLLLTASNWNCDHIFHTAPQQQSLLVAGSLRQWREAFSSCSSGLSLPPDVFLVVQQLGPGFRDSSNADSDIVLFAVSPPASLAVSLWTGQSIC